MRALAGTGAIVAFLVSLMMLVLPATGAPSFPGSLISAPYQGTVTSLQGSATSVGCAAASLLHNESWSMHSGIGKFSGQANASTCPSGRGGAGVSSSGSSTGEFDLSLPLALSSGSHAVTANWTLQMAGSQSTSVRSACPPVTLTKGNGQRNCFAEAQFGVLVYFSIQDQTNWTYFYSSGPINWVNQTLLSNVTTCYAGSCNTVVYKLGGAGSFSGRLTASLVVTGTFVHSHTYVMIIRVLDSATSEIQGYHRSSAHASLNMASNAKGIDLNFVQVV